MAINRVPGQNTGAVVNASSIIVPFPASVSFGNILIVSILSYNGAGAAALPTITKVAGSAVIGSSITDGDLQNAYDTHSRLTILRVPVSGSGSLTLSIASSNATGILVAMNEYSGSAIVVDGSSYTSTGTGTTETTASISVTAGGVVTCISSDLSSTNFSYVQSDNYIYMVGTGGSTATAEIQDKFIPSTGIVTLNAATGVSMGWVTLAVAYKESVVDTTAPTITSFTLPSTFDSLTVPITTFTATDNVNVVGYLVNTNYNTPGTFLSDWNSIQPTVLPLPNEGTWIVYAWAKDIAGNVSAPASGIITLSISPYYENVFCNVNPSSRYRDGLIRGAYGQAAVNIFNAISFQIIGNSYSSICSESSSGIDVNSYINGSSYAVSGTDSSTGTDITIVLVSFSSSGSESVSTIDTDTAIFSVASSASESILTIDSNISSYSTSGYDTEIVSTIDSNISSYSTSGYDTEIVSTIDTTLVPVTYPSVTDTFIRANSNPASGWTTVTGLTPVAIFSNKLWPSIDQTTNIAYYAYYTPPNDQFVEGTFDTLLDSGICARMSGTDQTFYFLDVYPTYIQLYSAVAGTYTQLGTTFNDTWNNTKVYRIECLGTSIKTYINGSLAVSATDTAIAGGYAGVFLYRIGDSMTYWKAGSLSAGSSYSVSNSESVSGIESESITFGTSSAISESVSANDLSSILSTLVSTLTEIVSTIDTNTSIYNVSSVSTEITTAVDNILALLTTNSIISELSTGLDVENSIKINLAITSESLSGSDNSSTANNAVSIITESASGIDIITSLNTAISTLIEAVTSSDSTSLYVGSTNYITEAVLLIDNALTTILGTVSIQEISSAIDNISEIYNTTSSIVEVVSTIDTLLSAKTVLGLISEALSGLDLNSSSIVNSSIIAEALSGIDITSVTNIDVAAIVELVSSLDIVSIFGTNSVTIIEAALAIDSILNTELALSAINEIVTSTDLNQSIANLISSLVETVNSVSTQSSSYVASSVVIEVVSLIDVLSSTEITLSSIIETAMSIDILTGGNITSSIISEIVNSTDTNNFMFTALCTIAEAVISINNQSVSMITGCSIQEQALAIDTLLSTQISSSSVSDSVFSDDIVDGGASSNHDVSEVTILIDDQEGIKTFFGYLNEIVTLGDSYILMNRGGADITEYTNASDRTTIIGLIRVVIVNRPVFGIKHTTITTFTGKTSSVIGFGNKKTVTVLSK